MSSDGEPHAESLPLEVFPLAERQRVRGVLADIDDTLTSDGRLTAQAYGAMERLQAAGLLVIPITGRPAGWCDLIARFWPVDAVVGENGAFYFHFNRVERRVVRHFQVAEATRVENRKPAGAAARRDSGRRAGLCGGLGPVLPHRRSGHRPL